MILGFLVIPVCLTKCSTKDYDWKGGLLNRMGEYHLLKNGYILKVSNNDGLLNYVLEGPDQNIILKSQENISVYQRWSMFWDDKNNLWIYSSDIGTFCWERIAKDKYKEVSIERGSDLEKLMPSALKR